MVCHSKDCMLYKTIVIYKYFVSFWKHICLILKKKWGEKLNIAYQNIFKTCDSIQAILKLKKTKTFRSDICNALFTTLLLKCDKPTLLNIYLFRLNYFLRSEVRHLWSWLYDLIWYGTTPSSKNSIFLGGGGQEYDIWNVHILKFYLIYDTL